MAATDPISAARTPPPERGVRAIVLFLALAIGVSLVLHASRIVALFGPLREFNTTGGENQAIYDVWKAAHGHPLYQFPERPPYDSTLYNFLFYRTYGGLSAILGLDGDGLLVASRLLTFAFALLGALAQWRTMRFLLPDAEGRTERRLLGSVALATWLGSTFVAWWLLTVRPDLPANALAATGLLCFFRALGPGGGPFVALSAAAFYSAWGFKQAVVWMLAAAVGTGLFFRESRSRSLVLGAVVGAGMALTLALGTPEYRAQTIVAPTWSPLDASVGLRRFYGVVAPNLFFFALAALPLLLALLRRRAELPPVARDRDRSIAWRIACVAALAATATNAIALAKEGSGRNQFMEAFVAVATVAGVQLVRLLRAGRSDGRTRALRVLAVLAFILVLRPIHSFAEGRLRGVLGATPEEFREHRSLEAAMRGLPRPVFIEDGILGLPWHANDGRYPTIVVDWVPYLAAKRRGILEGDGLAGYATRREFGAILTSPKDSFYAEIEPAARSAGYVDGKLPEDLKARGWQLLLRPREPQGMLD